MVDSNQVNPPLPFQLDWWINSVWLFHEYRWNISSDIHLLKRESWRQLRSLPSPGQIHSTNRCFAARRHGRPGAAHELQAKSGTDNQEQMSSDVTFCMPRRSVWFPSQHAVDPVCQEHQDYLSRCHGGASWHQRGGSEKLPGTNCAKIHCAGMDIRGRPSKWWTLLWYPQVIEHSYGKSPLLMGIYHL